MLAFQAAIGILVQPTAPPPKKMMMSSSATEDLAPRLSSILEEDSRDDASTPPTARIMTGRPSRININEVDDNLGHEDGGGNPLREALDAIRTLAEDSDQFNDGEEEIGDLGDDHVSYDRDVEEDDRFRAVPARISASPDGGGDLEERIRVLNSREREISPRIEGKNRLFSRSFDVNGDKEAGLRRDGSGGGAAEGDDKENDKNNRNRSLTPSEAVVVASRRESAAYGGDRNSVDGVAMEEVVEEPFVERIYPMLGGGNSSAK